MLKTMVLFSDKAKALLCLEQSTNQIVSKTLTITFIFLPITTNRLGGLISALDFVKLYMHLATRKQYKTSIIVYIQIGNLYKERGEKNKEENQNRDMEADTMS